MKVECCGRSGERLHITQPSVLATSFEQLLVRADQAGTPAAQLTPRQRAVLALVAEGRSNAAIAARLFISEKTVVNHLTSIYMTLGLELDDDSHRRVQAVLAFLSSRSS